MKNFFYFCAALLCLSLAFHFGYTTARAQAPGNPAVTLTTASGYSDVVLTANGDIYYSPNGALNGPWVHVTNIFSGGPTPALHESWGQLKSRYAPKSAPTSQPPADR